MLNVVVCVSGGGTNLQAILDAVESGKITNTRIAGVISNNAGAYALERAKAKNFEERLEKNDLLPLEEGKRYLLVETSYFNPPMGLLSVLQRIQKKGYYPLLAHPERYEYMQKKDYKALKEEHIFFQLNVPSLAGMYGRHVQEKAEALLKAKAYYCIGCDIHSAFFYHKLLQSDIRKKIVMNFREES